MNTGSVSVAFEEKIGLGDIDCLFEIIVRETSHYRTHLLFAYNIFSAYAISFDDYHSGIFGEVDTGFVGNKLDALPYNVASQHTVFEYGIDDFLTFVAFDKIGSLTLESFENFFLVAAWIDETLFALADNAVVERTSGYDFARL